jgi:hypothetical protein
MRLRVALSRRLGALDYGYACFIDPIVVSFSSRKSRSSYSYKLSKPAFGLRPDYNKPRASLTDRFLSQWNPRLDAVATSARLEKDDPVRHPLYTKRRLASLDTKRLELVIAREAFRTS